MRSLVALRRRLLGLTFVAFVVLIPVLCIAVYRGAFSRDSEVVLRAGSLGNQILPQSNVKVRGMIVGQVREVVPVPGGAQLRLAIAPDKISRIPANVSAQLLPSTLFGERYVALRPPADESSRPLTAGDVIEQDRSKASVELQQVLADTMPVLQAVRPQDLAVTLNGLSQALDGRGRSVGETISELNRYVAGLNPSLPQLQQNLREAVGVAETYEQAAPDVLEGLGELSSTARTLVEQRANLSALTGQLTATSEDTTGFLQDNSENLIRMNASARPTLDVLAKYAPEYPCVFAQSAGIIPEVNRVFGVGTAEPGVHITLEVVPNRGKYVPSDAAVYGDERGPRCYPMVRAPQYPPDGPVQDGTSSPPPARTGDQGVLPSSDASSSANSGASGGAAPELGVANSPAERELIAAIAALPQGADVPPWSSLLLGPLLRGTEITAR